MIQSFGDKDVKMLYEEYKRPKWLSPELLARAYAKLAIIDAAASENDLLIPPSNQYEKLKGKQQGFSSIRINDQWRLVFEWRNNNAYGVIITDYHRRKK